RGDDADLADIERARHPGQAGGHREHEELEGGGRVAAEEPARLAVPDGHEHLPRRSTHDPAAKKVRGAEAEGGDDVEAALGSRLIEGKPEHRLEAGESVGAAEVHGVAIEGRA